MWLAVGVGLASAPAQPEVAEELSRVTAEREALAEELRVARAALEQARQEQAARAQEWTQAARTTRADLAAMQARITAAETAASQAGRTRDQALAQVTTLRQTVSALERAAAARASASAGAGTDESRLAMQRALEQSAQRIEELTRENARLEEDLRRSGAAAAQELAALRSQLQALQDQGAAVAASQPEPEPTPAPDADRRWQAMEEQLARLERENASLARQLEPLRSERNALSAQLAAALARQEELAAAAARPFPAVPGDGATETVPATFSSWEPEGRSAPPAADAFPAGGPSLGRSNPQRPPPSSPPSVVRASAPVSARAPTPVAVERLMPATTGTAAGRRQPPTRPGAPAAALPQPGRSGERVHVVAEGDSLTRISARYYGTARRWAEIFAANEAALGSAPGLRPGQRLRIP